MLTYFDKQARGWQDIGENRWRIPGVTYVPNPPEDRPAYANGAVITHKTLMRGISGTVWVLRTHPSDVPDGIDPGEFHRDRYRRATEYRLAQVDMSLVGYSETWDVEARRIIVRYSECGVVTREVRHLFDTPEAALAYYFPLVNGVRSDRDGYAEALVISTDPNTGQLSKADMMRRTRAAKKLGYQNWRDYVAKNPGDPSGAFLFSSGGMGGANVSADGKRETGRLGNAHA